MILNKKVATTWHARNRAHYESLGYEFEGYGVPLQVPPSHLPPTSTVKVNVKCVSCSKRTEGVPYKDYLRRKSQPCAECSKASEKPPHGVGFYFYGKQEEAPAVPEVTQTQEPKPARRVDEAQRQKWREAGIKSHETRRANLLKKQGKSQEPLPAPEEKIEDNVVLQITIKREQAEEIVQIIKEAVEVFRSPRPVPTLATVLKDLLRF